MGQRYPLDEERKKGLNLKGMNGFQIRPV
jgi:hypothetical protein